MTSQPQTCAGHEERRRSPYFPCIDPAFGPTQASDGYWSTSSILNDAGDVWHVHFNLGAIVSNTKTIVDVARAVRSGR